VAGEVGGQQGAPQRESALCCPLSRLQILLARYPGATSPPAQQAHSPCLAHCIMPQIPRDGYPLVSWNRWVGSADRHVWLKPTGQVGMGWLLAQIAAATPAALAWRQMHATLLTSPHGCSLQAGICAPRLAPTSTLTPPIRSSCHWTEASAALLPAALLLWRMRLCNLPGLQAGLAPDAALATWPAVLNCAPQESVSGECPPHADIHCCPSRGLPLLQARPTAISCSAATGWRCRPRLTR